MASDSAIPIATLALAGVLTANALWSEWIRQKSISDLQKHIQAVERCVNPYILCDPNLRTSLPLKILTMISKPSRILDVSDPFHAGEGTYS